MLNLRMLSLGLWLLLCVTLRAQDSEEAQPEPVQEQASEQAEEQAPEETPKKVPQYTIIATPLRETDVFDLPNSVWVVDSGDIQGRRMPRTMGKTLLETPGAHIQQTGPGQGVPFLRGLDPYRSLVLIDGIRLNHSAMRSGPNQYFGTVDPFIVDHMEIALGPSSVLYGSDSLGGTIYVHTKNPWKLEPGTHAHIRSLYRYASAEDSHTARQEFYGNFDELGWSVGATYQDFGEMIGGRHIGEMEGTDYGQYSGDAKFLFRLNEHSRLILAHQHHRINDRPRWHSTYHNDDGWQGTSTGSDLRRDQDQERNLTYLQYHWNGEGGMIDAFKASVSWQRHDEKKVRERRASDGRVSRESFEINTPAVWIQAGKETPAGYFTAGAEFYRDIADSVGTAYDPTPSAPLLAYQIYDRGIIAGDATYDTFGLFLQDEYTIGKLDLTGGIRYTHIRAKADDVDPAVVDNNAATPDDPAIPNDISETYSAVTGSLRAVYHLNDHWNAIAGWGMGFRAPTLHDTTAIDYVLSGGGIQLPAEDLDPEYIHTFDTGFRTRYDTWELSAFAFFSVLDDFLAKENVGDVNGDGSDDYRVNNFADGWIYGYEVGAKYWVTKEIGTFFVWSYSKGRRDEPGTDSDQPLPKVGPSRAHLGVRYEPADTGVWVEGVVTAAAAQKHLDPTASGDTQRQPPNGTPGYGILTLRGGWKVNEHVTLTAAIENVTDKDYRIHGSGQNEPGTNAVLGVEVNF